MDADQDVRYEMELSPAEARAGTKKSPDPAG